MALTLAGALAGCTATIEDPSRAWAPSPNGAVPHGGAGDAEADARNPTGSQDAGSPYAPTAPTFECVPGSASVSPLRRLTRLQYTNSLRDLLTWALDDPVAADQVMNDRIASLAQIPQEASDIKTMGQDITQALVEGHYETAQGVADSLTATSSVVATVVGACATDADTSNDDACIDSFIQTFTGRAFRRPLTAEDTQFLRQTVYDAEGIELEALRDLIVATLMAPQFIFHTEFSGALVPGSADTWELDAYAVASRLSYHFWQSMPDEALLAAAADGSLLTDEGYRTQVERLFDHPRTASVMDDYFIQWLHLEAVAQPADEVGTEPFDTFAGDDVPSPALQGHMVQEILDMARYYMAGGGTLSDLFTSELSFTADEGLAKLYGVPTWDGTGTPPRFPAGERSGLMTRAAFLVSGTWHTLPIHKGVVLRDRILCDSLGLPPEGAMNAVAELEAPYTQREYADELTMKDGSVCSGCHQVINPLGYVTENYDALGRYRDQEYFWHEDTEEVEWLDIDTAAVPRVHFDDPTPVADGVEAAHLVVDSGKPQACFARYYFRFTFGRLEDVTEDACTLEWIRSGLQDGAPLAEVMRDVALRPEFKLKRLGPTE